jgi:hypothetical protein
LKKLNLGEFGRHLFSKILKATASDGKYLEVLEEVKIKGEPFTDEVFPPNEFSLIRDWDDPEVAAVVKHWRKFNWIRATDIEELNDKDGQLSVFAGEIEPSDIKQGELGDCYFLSVLSILTEVPKRIRNLFIT